MKRLTTIAMVTLLLLSVSAGAIADRDRYQKHGKYYDKHYDKHYRHHDKRHVYYYPRPHYRPVYYVSRPYYDPYYGLGAALIGAAVTHSLYHSHDGVRCDNSHSVTAYSSSAQVSACHRMERYADGSERRIDLPLSECY